jgi:hypothetical protein
MPIDQKMLDEELRQARDRKKAAPRKELSGLDAAVANRFGFDPEVERLGLLPYPRGALTKGSKVDLTDWVAPQFVYDAAKAFSLPGYAAQGGEYLPEDVADMAAAVSGGGMAFGKIPAGALGMAARQSRADNVAQGLYHPIGKGQKLDKPVSQMQFTQQDIQNLPQRQFIKPEQMQNAIILPATGDRTAAGRLLTSIEGVTLPQAVTLEGGPDFMRTHLPHGSAWASDKGVISGLSKRVQEAAKMGNGDVYMVYMPMGHSAGDFSTMMTDALLQQVKGGKITKKAKREFDEEVQRLRPEWKGLEKPGAREQLNANGALRHAFIDRMKLDKFREAGFPDLPSARAAITEPLLMDVPIHHGGFSIAKMDPTGRVITNPVAPHTTYNTQLGGQYVGGFERPIPREFLFSGFTDARRAANTDPAGDMRSFNLSYPYQKADQQWLNRIMQYMNINQQP